MLRRAGFVEPTAAGKLRPRKGLTPHVARHSRASLIAARHSELFAPKLQRFLSHDSVTLTLAKYGYHTSLRACSTLGGSNYETDDVAELGDPASGGRAST